MQDFRDRLQQIRREADEQRRAESAEAAERDRRERERDDRVDRAAQAVDVNIGIGLLQETLSNAAVAHAARLSRADARPLGTDHEREQVGVNGDFAGGVAPAGNGAVARP